MSFNIVKKISLSLVSDSMEIGGAAVRVAGQCQGFEEVEGSFGTSKKFSGDFALKHGDDVYRAAVLYLPAVAADLLAIEAINAASTPGFHAFEFAFDLSKIKDEDKRNAKGYKWGVSLVREPVKSEVRSLALLDGEFGASVVVTSDKSGQLEFVPTENTEETATDSTTTEKPTKGKGK